MTYSYGNSSSPQARSRSNPMAVAALVCGIVGLFVLSVVLGPLAIVFGSLGMRNAERGGARNRGVALAGVILGAIDVVLFVIAMIAVSNGGFSWHIG